MSIFRKKDVGLAQTEMKRHLTLRDVVLLGIGAMVGTGIFTITGTAASTLAGPALIISVLISAVCVGMSAISLPSLPHVTHQPVVSTVTSMLSGESILPGWVAG